MVVTIVKTFRLLAFEVSWGLGPVIRAHQRLEYGHKGDLGHNVAKQTRRRDACLQIKTERQGYKLAMSYRAGAVSYDSISANQRPRMAFIDQ